MIKVLVKKLKPSVKLPSYKTNGASGMDLMAYIDKSIELKPGESCLIPTGLSVAFPKEYEIQIRPRSGLAAKNNISVLNTPGTIDSDYRGPVGVIIVNISDAKFLITHGMRIAQIVFAPTLKVQFQVSKNLSQTDRSTGGFGSTGTK